jgi:hypothetical protein
MGIAKKLHRKKVAARNARIKSDMKKIEAAVSQFIEQTQKAQEIQEAKQNVPTLGFGPVSAIQAATSEKNKNQQI